MSRIGNKPIALPAGVSVQIAADNTVTVKGPKGTLSQKIDPDISVKVEEGKILVQRPTDQKRHKALHGLYRALLNNMVIGVSQGFKKQLELIGVGYKAEAKGQLLQLSLGYSHGIVFAVPNEVKVTAETPKGKAPLITLESIDKQLLGQIAAKIRSFRKPEPYKGKGVKYVDEVIRRKAGKTAAKK
ncbi:MAG: 50S ribosomal protein L6 [Cytophagales bacterium]|nr:50S ribosomal protein L6 [Bernardetiaceae bacterium]MDW8209909.1 50S ribosomal protein L6 [Cytophagales bacterium]